MKQYNRDAAARWLSGKILQAQIFFAWHMQRLPIPQQRMAVLSGCMICMVCSILTIINAFKEKPKVSLAVLGTVPKQIAREKYFLITEEEFQKVKLFKATHDSLLGRRPGLKDSLDKVEELYYSQQK